MIAHVVEGLVTGATYLFRVCAANEVGVGKYSKPTETVAIVKEVENESEGLVEVDEEQLKKGSFEIEYEMGEEIYRLVM